MLFRPRGGGRYAGGMNRLRLLGVIGVSAASGALAGPDLIIADMQDITHWTGAGPVDGFRAYSFGLRPCNIGDQVASWFGSSAAHPVITQNLYRIADGRIQQIGLGLAWHGFRALQQDFCGECQPGGDTNHLGVGCSSLESASIMGTISGMGRRAQVNAATGAFPYPPGALGCSGAICARLRVAAADLQNNGAIYLAESLVVQFEDAASDNDANNASHRRITFNASGGAAFMAPTQQAAAMYGWQDVQPGVRIDEIHVPDDGVVLVGSYAVNIGGGVWRYTIAIQNLTSDRAIRSLTLQMGADPSPGAFEFRDVQYHSGEPYDGTDWPVVPGGASFFWTCPQTFAQNPDANAIRWGTMYTFTFESAATPHQGQFSMGLFKPGAVNAVAAGALLPSSTFCPTDVDGDLRTDFADLNAVLGVYGLYGESGADVDGDGDVDFTDLNLLLGQYGQNC